MTERERVSLLVQLLGIGVVLFVGGGWVFSQDFMMSTRYLDFIPGFLVLQRATFVVLMALPSIFVIGLIALMIRCFKKSK